MAHDVFISYSAKDKTTADGVCATLETKGIRCWIAPRDILPGMDWGEAIIEAINGSRVIVLVFSSNANDSQQIKREVERAVSKGLPIIPLRIENVAPARSLEYFIGPVHWLDALTPPLEKHLQSLSRSRHVVRKEERACSGRGRLYGSESSGIHPKSLAKPTAQGQCMITNRGLATESQAGPLPLVIGVTGHRDLRSEDRETLAGRLREIIAELRVRYPHTPLILLSPLAEGADRLAAWGGTGMWRAALRSLADAQGDLRNGFSDSGVADGVQ
jgi:hypothetical protein